jgi:hypothetical protein
MSFRSYLLACSAALLCAASLGCGSQAPQQKPDANNIAESAPAETARTAPAKDVEEKSAASVGKAAAPESASAKHPEPAADQALLTVYSSPQGVVMIDGRDTGKITPATVELKVDELNKVQVRFDDDSVSAAKEVTGKAGVRYKVFIESAGAKAGAKSIDAGSHD